MLFILSQKSNTKKTVFMYGKSMNKSYFVRRLHVHCMRSKQNIVILIGEFHLSINVSFKYGYNIHYLLIHLVVHSASNKPITNSSTYCEIITIACTRRRCTLASLLLFMCSIVYDIAILLGTEHSSSHL